VALTNTAWHLADGPSSFRARDVFAPVAARLCAGVDLADLGEPIDPVLLMPGVVPLPRDEGDSLAAEVLWVDRFGNAQLNVGPDDLEQRWGMGPTATVTVTVRDVAGQPVRRVATWVAAHHEVTQGALGLIVDATGMLALVANRSSAAVEVGVAAGDQVLLTPTADDGGARGVTTPVNLQRR
jgi:hypothetical protein